MKMKQTGVRLDDDLKGDAIERAKGLNRTFGSYVRNLIKEDLKKAQQELQAAADKSEKSGVADLKKALKAINHGKGKK